MLGMFSCLVLCHEDADYLAATEHLLKGNDDIGPESLDIIMIVWDPLDHHPLFFQAGLILRGQVPSLSGVHLKVMIWDYHLLPLAG